MNILTSEKKLYKETKNMNSIQKKIMKIASNLADEMIQSFEMTESEWEKYSEQHPNAKKENHTITPDSQGKSNGSEKLEMTDEQKKLHQMAMSEDLNDRISVAQSEKAHPKTLDKLSGDKNKYVRRSVAQNPSAHPKTLDKLSGDEEETIRAWVAYNPNTHPKTLDKLREDRHSRVRLTVLNNPNYKPRKK